MRARALILPFEPMTQKMLKVRAPAAPNSQSRSANVRRVRMSTRTHLFLQRCRQLNGHYEGVRIVALPGCAEERPEGRALWRRRR
jgi:hypothetical protein